MADQKQDNQTPPGINPADETAKVSKTASASVNSTAEIKSGVAGNANAGTVAKKPKTEKQIARERERRRRRRKKKAEIKGLGGEKVLRPGDDVPLIVIKEGEETAKLQPPEDNQLIEASLNNVPPEPPAIIAPLPPEEEFKPELKIQQEEQAEPEVVVAPEPLSEPEPEIAAEPESAPEPEIVPEPQPEITPEPEPQVIIEPEHLEEHLDNSQQIFEESPSYIEEPGENEKADQDKVREIKDSLLSDQHDHLEEMPVRQGILGKIFDKFAEIVQGRKTQGLPASMKKINETIVTEVSPDKSSPSMASPGVSGISTFLANLIKFVVVIALVVGAFWLGSSLKVVDRISGLFATQSGGEQLAMGDNSQVVIDPLMMQKWGFETARLIGSNIGDGNDLTYNVFFNANYFGKLKDPVFYGETGVSAAIFYGFGKEVQSAQNRFINYVHYLAAVVNANSVKLMDVLKSNARRDIALDKYLKDSQDIFDQGNTLRKEINVQIDDLKVSIATLTPDKTRYETDFFASMSEYDGEKANALLAQFVLASQTNVELTAKQNALSKLTQSYETELLKLKTRITALQANRDALISGVPFSETATGGITLTTQ